MSMISTTPRPPYYAVIFTSVGSDNNDGYEEMAQKMAELASRQTGFLGMETAREDVSITVSYWADLEAIKNWKANLKHREAQSLGRDKWYSGYKVRVSKVEHDYGL